MSFRFKRRATTHSNSTIATLRLVGSTGLSDGTVGQAYAATFLAQGGVQPYAAYTAIGSVPAGLTLSTNGDLSGTPSTTSISTFSVHVIDALGSTARDGYRLQVNSSGASGPLELSIANSTGAPQGVVGSTYVLSLNSTGGVAPYTAFALVGGALPTGITLASSGSLNGTPSTTGVSTFTLQVTDSVGSTARQSFRLAVISSVVDNSAFGYFNTLVALPEHFGSWNHRSSSQLAKLVKSDGSTVSTSWMYIWPDDDYHDPQNAAKAVKTANSSAFASEAFGQQLHHPVNLSTGKILITWDAYYGNEYRTNIGGLGTYKAFNFRDSGSPTGGNPGIYIETRCGWANAPSTEFVCTVTHRSYGNLAQGQLAKQPYNPAGEGSEPIQSYGVKPAKWNRYWLEVRLNQPSSAFTSWMANSTGVLTTNYHMVSAWIADEDRDPVRLLYQVPWTIRNPYLASFDYEFDTSGPPSSGGNAAGQTGTVYAYSRGVVMLQNYALSESDTTIFKKPIR